MRQGIVPYFYGYALSLDTEPFGPHLNAFSRDLHPPSPVLIEYLPNDFSLNCVNYSRKRMAKLVDGIKQIHLALVEHNDPYPRNNLIFL